MRALLALNLLVENSSFVGDADSGKAGKLPTMKQAQFIREQFAGAHEACQQALDLRQPLVDEPVITVVDLEGGRTLDPCTSASLYILLAASLECPCHFRA